MNDKGPTGESATERLRRTERMAEEAASEADDEELLSAASDLVAWGSMEPASRLIATLRERTDRFARELEALERVIKQTVKGDVTYSDKLLARSIDQLDDPDIRPARLVQIADSLVMWGALDEAERAISLLEKNKNFRQSAVNLRSVARTLRASGIMDALSSPGNEASDFNRPREIMFGTGSGPPGTAVLVFTGAQRRFWVSLQVFFHLLRRRAGHVIFLADQSNTCFLNGLASVAPTYGELLGHVRGLLKERGVKRTRIMATSAGGFVGLRMAADLPAVRFVGFGIRTSFAGNLPMAEYDQIARSQCRDKSMLVDLRAYLANRLTPGQIVLYATSGTKRDSRHAIHLHGLPRTDVRMIESDQHDSVPLLLQSGEFGQLLDEFFS